MGLTALGAPVLVETLLPRLNSYEPLFEVRDNARCSVLRTLIGWWVPLPAYIGTSNDLAMQDEAQTPISMHVRAALVVALGRCMSWGNGRHANAILSSVPNTGSAFWAALQAVAPAGHVHI